MKKIGVSLLASLVLMIQSAHWGHVASPGRVVKAQPSGSGHLSLMFAENSLSLLYPEKVPTVQSGFVGSDDLWVLYSSAFDSLSGGLQSYLMRKYGLLDSSQIRSGVAEESQSSSAATDPTLFGGENVKVNTAGLNLRFDNQSETCSATSGSNILVAYNNPGHAGFGTGISYSKDRGRTWTQTQPSVYPFGQGIADPVLAAGPDGVFYYSMIAADFGLLSVGVTKSTDGGATWSPLVNVTSGITSRFEIHDKEWMTADNTNSPYRGNIYVSWTRITQRPPQLQSSISFSRSTDGGKTWSPAQAIGPPLTAVELGQAHTLQFSMIAVGPAGEVYVAYFDSRIPGIAVVKSVDGGQTFGPPVTAIQTPSSAFARNLSGGFEIVSGPSLAVDTTGGPNRGTVYLTTSINSSQPLENEDVIMARSTDGGKSWGAPRQLNDDQSDTDQFQPSLAVAPDGTLGVMWYDRRNDPTNDVLIDVYLTTSSDGGRTFSPNRRLTSGNWMIVPTSLGANRNTYHGDYNQMSAGDVGFVLNWGDERSGVGADVFAAVMTPSQARVEPADLVISSRTLNQNVLAGEGARFTINHVGKSLSGGVVLQAAPSYEGLSYRFARDFVTATGETTLTVTTMPGTAPGTYPITIVGTIGSFIRTTTVRLTVYDPNQLRQLPRAITSVRDTFSQPRAVVDKQKVLHVVSGIDSRRLFASFGGLVYTQFRNGTQVISTPVARTDRRNINLTGHGIGVDDGGVITVVWTQNDPTTNAPNIFMSRSTDQGRTFAAPISVTQNRDQRLRVLSLAFATSQTGTINVAYAQSDLGTGVQDIYFTRSTDGGRIFSSRVNVSKNSAPAPLATVASPALAVDNSGAINIAYVGATSQSRADVFYVRSQDGVEFSTPANLTRTTSSDTLFVNVLSPALAVDPSGNITIVYVRLDRDQGFQDVFLTRSSDNGRSFSTPVNVSRSRSPGVMAFFPVVGVDERGRVGIAWVSSVPGLVSPGGRDIFFSQSSDGGRTFSTAINLSQNIGHLGQTLGPPSVVTDESGELMVLWEDETGGNSQIYLLTP